jgi:SAM-dependent methyltransferase
MNQCCAAAGWHLRAGTLGWMRNAAWAVSASLAPISALLAMAPAHAQDMEVPFITTPDAVTEAMLNVAGVNETDVLYDLGSGDGRIVIAAARLHGARAVGVEIVPELVQRSRANARRAGVADKVQFVEQDLFASDLQAATVITMYLLPEVNLQLRPRLLALAPGTRIVSHDWDMGDWLPDRTLVIDVPEKAIGREKTSRVHFWLVPAQVGGEWCQRGAGKAQGQRLSIDQHFQTLQLRWQREGQAQRWTMRALGRNLIAQPRQGAPLRSLQATPDGRLLAQGHEFERCGGN